MNPNNGLQIKKRVTVVTVGKDTPLPKYQAMKARRGWEVMLHALWNLVLDGGA
jgi:hypothetical protein